MLHDGDELEIIQGRHPVIEAFIDEPFVPNSIYLNNSTDRLLIITGPNMGGKSTVLRQTAIICILAQTGCFVPAERARLPLLDRIWTRVGASDDLTRGSFDVHGGDDGDRGDPAQCDAALTRAA